MGKVLYKNGVKIGGAAAKSATSTKYDNTNSGLAAVNVQEAIDETNSNLMANYYTKTEVDAKAQIIEWTKGAVTSLSYPTGYTKDNCSIQSLEFYSTTLSAWVSCLTTTISGYPTIMIPPAQLSLADSAINILYEYSASDISKLRVTLKRIS